MTAWTLLDDYEGPDGDMVIMDGERVVARLPKGTKTSEAWAMAAAIDLREALRGALRHLITPAGLPNRVERTEAQQTALEAVQAATAKAHGHP